MAELLLEARGLTKRFPGVLACDAVALRLAQGEILGLLGENGAGKSTLVKMLFGLYAANEGEVLIDGAPVVLDGPGDAIRRGIGMVHQHFQLVPPLTVAENIVLGAEPVKGRFLDLGTAEQRVAELSKEFGLAVDPHAVVENLPVGVQQRVEILKALYRHARILILDEPTAVLTPQETDELLGIMREMAAGGVGIIFITHKLREVLAVTDRVTVMRDGKVVGDFATAGSTQESLAEAMVGRTVVLRVEKQPAQPGAPVLQATGIRVLARGKAVVDGVDLEVRAGEILGIAGVQGNGQRELVEALTGIHPVAAGTFTVAGHDATHLGARRINELGVAHIPEDREKAGFVGVYSVADNLVLTNYYEQPYARHGFRQAGEVDARARMLVEQYDVRTPSIGTPMKSLSGGNKQKAIVARELSAAGNVLVVADQPTRGVDVGSIEFIHQQLIAARDAGTAILLVSAELDEIFALADRIAVMYEGRIVATLDAAEATRERVGLLMAGAQPVEAA